MHAPASRFSILARRSLRASSGLAALRRDHDVTAPAACGEFRPALGAMRPARCCPRYRQPEAGSLEKCTAVAPIGEGPDSPKRPNHYGIQPIACRCAKKASRSRHR
jgi:hypothetical protein